MLFHSTIANNLKIVIAVSQRRDMKTQPLPLGLAFSLETSSGATPSVF